jgi:hypothetical protein
MNKQNVQTYFDLARERYHIMLRRRAGLPREQWTNDPIFQQWRFCNVRREDDKTTEWFRNNIRGVLQKRGSDVLFATIAFRWFNRIETGEKILEELCAGPDDWDPDAVRRKLSGVKPIVTGAYMIKTPPGMNKLEGILKCIEDARPHIHEMAFHCEPDTTLEGMWTALRMFPYLGSFMAYEIVTDLRHTCLLKSAPDINTWAVAGPGCARGMGWVVSGDPERWKYAQAKHQEQILFFMKELLAISREERFWPQTWPAWEMREVEHWACEVWKYIRCRDHGQPPKEKFKCQSN